MVRMGIDGLASGLDTTSLIRQLMQIEAMPQTLLKTKQSTTQSFLSALQGLNTRVASLADAARAAAKPESWNAYTATTTGTSATATASATAQPGSLSFTVDAVATTQQSLSAVTRDDGSLLPSIPPAVTIKKNDGTFVTVQPTTGSLADIAKAISSAADAGVTATVVRVSNGIEGGEPEYRLQFTGTSTGTDGGFRVYAGTQAEVEAGGEAHPRLDSVAVRGATDATVTLWKGAAAEQSFTQSSNTFTNLMSGVDVTVTKVTAADEPATTVTVSRDPEALKKLASGLVGALGVVLGEIGTRTQTTTKVNNDGSTSVTGGLFSADSAIRTLRDQVTEAAARPVDGRSPAEIGIVLGRDGTFTFDEAKFTAALAADPARVQAMVTQLAERVAGVATDASDRYTGSLTRKITGQESLVKTMGSQIEDWDRRLEVRRAGLQRTYSALEVTLSGLQSQSSWLAGQLSSLPSWSNK